MLIIKEGMLCFDLNPCYLEAEGNLPQCDREHHVLPRVFQFNWGTEILAQKNNIEFLQT